MSDGQWNEAKAKSLECEKQIGEGEIRIAQSDHPVFAAVQTHDLDTIQGLLENGADIDVRDEAGRTPLMIAIEVHHGVGMDRHRKVLDLLLDHGADCTARDTDGKSVLCYAALDGSRDAIRALIDRGADVNGADKEGMTPLMYATHHYVAAPFLVQDLLQQGADPTLETNEGHTVWHFLRDNATAHVVHNRSEMGHVDSRGETVLMKICRKMDPELAKVALERGANISARNKEGKSALTIACEPTPHPDSFPDQVKLVSLLLEHGADPMDGRTDGAPVTAAVNDGIRLLHTIYAQDYEAAQELLERGTSTLVSRPEGGTPLMIAAECGDLRFVENLLAAGADVNVESRLAAINALVSAAAEGHAEVVKRLLEAGADVNARVRNRRDRFNTNALIQGSTHGHIDAVKVLLDAGADVNAYGEGGPDGEYTFTALSQAACEGHFELAKLLIESGADVNLEAPLAEAAERGHMDLVQLLVENGAGVNCSNGLYDLATPLMHAVRRERTDLVRHLLKHGADPEVTDAYGNSILSDALDRGNIKIVRMIERAIAGRRSITE